MTPEEACRVVAYFDGYRDAFNPCGSDFENHFQINKFLSLDELVLIWRKIGLESIKLNMAINYAHINTSQVFVNENAETIQEAAVIATAKAIQELENDNS